MAGRRSREGESSCSVLDNLKTSDSYKVVNMLHQGISSVRSADDPEFMSNRHGKQTDA